MSSLILQICKCNWQEHWNTKKKKNSHGGTQLSFWFMRALKWEGSKNKGLKNWFFGKSVVLKFQNWILAQCEAVWTEILPNLSPWAVTAISWKQITDLAQIWFSQFYFLSRTQHRIFISHLSPCRVGWSSDLMWYLTIYKQIMLYLGLASHMIKHKRTF